MEEIGGLTFLQILCFVAPVVENGIDSQLIRNQQVFVKNKNAGWA
jgi:hypothetical protein